MPLETLTQDLWPLSLLSIMVGIAIFPLALLCSFLYSAISHKFEHVPKPAWFLIVTILGTFIAVVAIYLYLDLTFSSIVQNLPAAPTA